MALEISGQRFLTVQGALDIIENIAEARSKLEVDDCSPTKRCKNCLYCAWEVIDNFYQKETRTRLGTSIGRMKV